MPVWLTALRLVPWGDVVKNAPQIADGARKLWQRVAKQKPPDAAPALSTSPGASEPLAALQARVIELEKEMRASSELIQSLAEQNTQLVAQVAQLLRRQRWLAAGLGLLGLAAFIAWSWR
jgi:hypothetical protein